MAAEVSFARSLPDPPLQSQASQPWSQQAVSSPSEEDVTSGSLPSDLSSPSLPWRELGRLNCKYLTTSPYLEDQHKLDLSTLDHTNRLMALALTKLHWARPDYAACEYEKAFNWNEVMETLKNMVKEERVVWKQQTFYVVEFRSKLKEVHNTDLLYMLDKKSHAEAVQSGWLLKYWYGSPDDERQNLATCLWRSKEDAVKGGQGPWHQQARNVIAQMYEKIHIKGLYLTIEDDVSAWRFLK